VFFQNATLNEYLIEALVNVYIDAERTGYYEKSSFRFYASIIMEYIWSDGGYREKFMQLGQSKPGLFIEFCNFLINDMNTLLFDGLLELEEIRDYEELSSSPDWTQLD
jgi:Ubiquitin elongating factor core